MTRIFQLDWDNDAGDLIWQSGHVGNVHKCIYIQADSEHQPTT